MSKTCDEPRSYSSEMVISPFPEKEALCSPAEVFLSDLETGYCVAFER